MGIAEEILQAYKPTEEDISRELTQEQLIKLCRRNRCRVDMWKWNVVEDCAQNFRDTGRLEGKSKKFIHKLLVKAYQRNKKLFEQTENEKDEERMEEWAYRKKNSLLQLDLWDYEENVQNQIDPTMTESEEQAVLKQQYEQNKKTVRIKNKQNNDTTIQKSVTSKSDKHMNITLLDRNERMSIDVGSERDAYAVPTVVLFPTAQDPIRSHNGLEYQGIAETEEHKMLKQRFDQNSTIMTVIHTSLPEIAKKQQQQKQNVSEEVASVVKEAMEINSESITVDSQILSTDYNDPNEVTSSEELIALNLSNLLETPVQPIVPTQSESYDDFHEQMPFTSTQDTVV